MSSFLLFPSSTTSSSIPSTVTSTTSFDSPTLSRISPSPSPRSRIQHQALKTSILASWRLESISSFWRLNTKDTRFQAALFQSRSAGLFALVFDDYEMGDRFIHNVTSALEADILLSSLRTLHPDSGVITPSFAEHEEKLIATLSCLMREPATTVHPAPLASKETHSWAAFLVKIAALKELMTTTMTGMNNPTVEEKDKMMAFLTSIETTAQFYSDSFRNATQVSPRDSSKANSILALDGPPLKKISTKSGSAGELRSSSSKGSSTKLRSSSGSSRRAHGSATTASASSAPHVPRLPLEKKEREKDKDKEKHSHKHKSSKKSKPRRSTLSDIKSTESPSSSSPEIATESEPPAQPQPKSNDNLEVPVSEAIVRSTSEPSVTDFDSNPDPTTTSNPGTGPDNVPTLKEATPPIARHGSNLSPPVPQALVDYATLSAILSPRNSKQAAPEQPLKKWKSDANLPKFKLKDQASPRKRRSVGQDGSAPDKKDLEEILQITTDNKEEPGMERSVSRLDLRRRATVLSDSLPQTLRAAAAISFIASDRQKPGSSALFEKRTSREKRNSGDGKRSSIDDHNWKTEKHLEERYSCSLSARSKAVLASYKRNQESKSAAKQDPIQFEKNSAIPKAAEVNRLVAYLVLENQSIEFLWGFLLGYRTLMNSSDFFELLLSFYQPTANPPGTIYDLTTEDQVHPVNSRVVFILSQWLQDYFKTDFGGRPELQRRLLAFCKQNLEHLTVGPYRLSSFILDPLISTTVMSNDLLNYAINIPKPAAQQSSAPKKMLMQKVKSFVLLEKPSKTGDPTSDAFVELLQEKEKDKDKPSTDNGKNHKDKKPRFAQAPNSSKQKSITNLKNIFNKATTVGGGGFFDQPSKSCSMPVVSQIPVSASEPTVFSSVQSIPLVVRAPVPSPGPDSDEEPEQRQPDRNRSASNPVLNLNGHSSSSSLPPVVRWTSSTIDLLMIPTNIIAACLTVVEQELFLKAHVTMCLDQNLIGSSAPVQRIVKHFNHVSNWVAHEIVMTPNLKTRTALLKHFISVAEHCRQINNFNTLLEITAGLNMAPVQRLKKTWKIGKQKKAFEAFEKLMDNKHNYQRYRQALSEAQLPCLPYFGIFLRDFTFIDVGNPTFVKKGWVNVDKLMLLWNVGKEFQRFQSVPYHFEEEISSFSHTLRNAIATVGAQANDDRLYHFSTLCEPNES